MRRSFPRFGALVFVFAMLLGAVIGGVAVAAQVHMVNARDDLKAALDQLNSANADKAGHRVNAINLVNQAIKEVNLGIDAAAE